jgi:hypothetical protein
MVVVDARGLVGVASFVNLSPQCGLREVRTSHSSPSHNLPLTRDALVATSFTLSLPAASSGRLHCYMLKQVRTLATHFVACNALLVVAA